MSEFIPEDLLVGEPAISVRWRLHNNALPLKNRHLRAFAHMGVSNGLESWARQHIEWTLAEGAMQYPDGVLTVQVDEQGRAAMGVEAYVELPALTSDELFARVSVKESLPVEDEVLWVFAADKLVALTDGAKTLSGVNSLLGDLAGTLGTPVEFVAERRADAYHDLVGRADAQVFMASDEHGVVAANDHAGDVATKFMGYYQRIVGVTHADAYDRANLGLR